MAHKTLLNILLVIAPFITAAQTTTDTAKLKEVVVTGRRPAIQREAGKLIVNVAGNSLFKTAANALDILKKTPGLEVGGDGSILLSGRITPVIFINGAPAPMSQEELVAYLNSLPADMIASIEVMNNPGAQYDASFKGIINIRLKPDQTLGWKSTLTTRLQQNAYTFSDNTLLVTFKTPKLAYTARVGYTTGNTIRRYNALQHLANSNIMATHSQTRTGNSNYTYQLNTEYTPHSNHRLELQLRAFQVNRSIYSGNTLHTTDSAAAYLVSHITGANNTGLTQNNYAANLRYSATWNGLQWTLLASVLTVRNRQQEDIQNTHTYTSQPASYWKTAAQNNILLRTLQTDVNGTVLKGKWSAGARFSFTTTRNQLHYDTLTNGGWFATDSGRTNSFLYKEYVTAGYLNYEKDIRNLKLTAGLRAEHTHTLADAQIKDPVLKRDYLNWLPGVTATYAFRKSRQLHLSLSRRITRPDFAQLNPFRFYFSPLNYWVGNPYLRSSTTTLLNLAYSQNRFTASVYAGKETDPSTRYPEYNPVTNELAYLGRNLPYNHFAGMEISFPVTVTPWWKMSYNLNGYYKKEVTPYHNATYTIPITTFTTTATQVFTLPKAITAEVYYCYSSPGGDGLYTGNAISNLDLGVQKSWLQGKLNTRINYYDLFNTYRITRTFREKNIINNRLSHWFGMQRLLITVSYTWGRSTFKAAQTQKAAEENRAGI